MKYISKRKMTETNVSLYKKPLINYEAFLKSLIYTALQIICENSITNNCKNAYIKLNA